jgi:hypothetical protein
MPGGAYGAISGGNGFRKAEKLKIASIPMLVFEKLYFVP